ncbi:Putative aminopeptidase YsdC [Lentilactobacillus hilgardii]|uniref:M42 family metallopeptidase n=1 Tax=Lentilactobacillus hilgardii TaxID=1588 RepID=UPI00019C489B|nr:M20/M25/M40 family metallo-hydrolase [Lentilactobacillus hilgardii]EEI20319.1 M42 glutamyl aminopeptidase [Lentilactobacillus buchneri ATCC 11577]MCT3396935.1 M42 family peptidase [Lentilactobacillus hilgardii]QIR08658.1 Putative aminopeptidase YsdC [Lentilactobacillus hilgardii]
MKKSEKIELIEKLSNANGPSGFEDEVADLVVNYSKAFSKVHADQMNNCYLEQPNNSAKKVKTLMIDSHVDAVGLIVQAIRPNGMIKFVELGHWVPANLTAEKMKIRNLDGEWITGLVATKPPHFMTEAEKKQPITIDHLSIDVGTTSAEETEKLLKISTGCPIVPDTEWQYLEKQDVMLGKAFDNRIGTAALITAMAELADDNFDFNLVGVAAAQEEVGCRGAKVTVRKVKPSIAICLEGCPADDTFTPDWLIQTGMHRGPMLRDMDTSFIANPHFQAFAVKEAQKYNIPYTRAVRTGGGIDGSEFVVYEGVPTICVGIPVRYEHTNYGMVAFDDFNNTVELLEHIIRDLDSKIISEL